jgi:hypothetical protein
MANGTDAEALAQIKKEFDGTSDSATEVLCRRKDGSEFWLGYSSAGSHERGSVVQYFASLVDLTKHKADKAKSRC